MGLGVARRRCQGRAGRAGRGQGPGAVEAARREALAAAEGQRADGTFAAVAELFIKQHLPSRRTKRSYEALIRRELLPVLGDKPIAEIRRRDIIALVDAIVARGADHPGRARPRSGGEYAARHALAAAKKLFNWAIGRDVEGLDANPCNLVRVTEGSPEPRTRVLTDAELRTVWQAAEATPYPFGHLIRALLLTGQRLREISELRWSEIDGSFLTIPAARMKSRRRARPAAV